MPAGSRRMCRRASAMSRAQAPRRRKSKHRGVLISFFLALALVTLLMLVGTCGVSLLASVWSRHTRNAAIVVYGLFGVVIALIMTGLPGIRLLSFLDPSLVLDAARDQPNYDLFFSRLGQFSLAWGVIGIVSTSIAIWRLQPAYLKQQAALGRGRIGRRFISRPPIDD